jgi:hypothetical protein
MARPRSTPPPLVTRRPARPAPRRARLPHPTHLDAEFLPDDLVVEDPVADFIDDEFVLEEEPRGPDVVFAGPSEAPPSLAPAGGPKRRRGPVAGAVVVASLMGAGMLLRQRGGEGAGRAAATASATASAMASATASATATAPVAATTTASEPPHPSAADAKQAAQLALDHGKASLAIDQGERSVALDPSDAEAWLILGAAYLQRGRYADARRCFKSCVHDADHGPRAECAALLR